MKTDVQSKLNPGEKNDIHLSNDPWENIFAPNHRKTAKKILVGILNCTPDSFYDGGKYLCPENALLRAEEMIQEGADLIDVGAESSRPGAGPISEKEELDRLLPVIKQLRHPFSIDSYKPAVIESALLHGACMINDITGGSNPKVRALAKEAKLPICIMHMQGSPKTMQQNPSYPLGVVQEIKLWFTERIELLLKEGLDPCQIILDPGIGFGKTAQHNWEILRNLEQFLELGYPLYLGFSRKTFLQKLLEAPSCQILPITLGLATLSLFKGAHFLRVHDVKEHKQIFTLMERL